ncbi:MAG: metallo-beta-lactamase [Flavobacteriales bacterium BRH_c54]|nr:MAG: metallo-beta-lactamase [Flavobacteriales bacterium BRH_c54]
MKIEFKGAARTVTGSKHLITTRNGKKILLDCGLFQGEDAKRKNYNKELGFEASEIDYCILSHAHIDHSGAIPYLVKKGFKGKIYCTLATLDLCQIMLVDSAHIQESDVKYINRARIQKELDPIDPLYTIEDAEIALQQFVGKNYDDWFEIDDEIEVCFTVVGHILGAAAVNLKIKEEGKIHTLCYTGDIGRKKHHIIKSPKPFPPAEYIICESTYGNRLHESTLQTINKLLNVVYYTCVEKKGKLIIPAFSLGRTQEIIYALDQLESAGKLPKIPVYVDSPLSTNATQILINHPEAYNEEIREYMKKDPNPFGFNGLLYIRDVEASKAINNSDEPCIIISASGMMEAGRVVHHLKNNLGNKKNTVLIVGYCAPFTLGNRLMQGTKQVKIYGEEIDVKADIEVITEYSAHGDYEEMIDFLSCQHPGTVKEMFLVHGTYEVQQEFREKLMEKGYRNIRIPDENSEYLID